MFGLNFISKRCSLTRQAPLPIFDFDTSGYEKYDFSIVQREYKGIFNGFNVIIETSDDMISIYTKGYFGKGSLSLGYPSFSEKLQKSENIEESNPSEPALSHHIVSSPSKVEPHDSSSELPHYSEVITEELHLSLEEAFFLSYAVKCLKIYSHDELLDHYTTWSIFQKVQPKFVERYVAYHYYRAKGWIVRSGIKYGSDYVLYKNGPPFFHATFVVFIISNIADGNNIDVNYFLACHRAVEVTKKEVLICRVKIPEICEVTNLNFINDYQVSEFTLKRWLPSENRNIKK